MWWVVVAGCTQVSGPVETPSAPPSAPASPEAPAPAPAPAPDPAEPASAPSGLAPGAACLASTDCASGICEGEGCDEASPGVCAPADRMCTMDVKPYCGCDGVTFQSSGSCPGARFEYEGACEEATDAGVGDDADDSDDAAQ